MKRRKKERKNGQEKGNNCFLFFIIIIIFISPNLYAVTDSGGSVSMGSTYDSNPGADLYESSSTPGNRQIIKNAGDFYLDFSSDLYIYPVKGLYLDYFTLLNYGLKNDSYSFFSHYGEIAYEHEFEKADFSVGTVFGHTVYDFNTVYNRIEIEPYLETVHYQSNISSGWYKLSFRYGKPFDTTDTYCEGFTVSADISEFITFMKNRSSFLINSLFAIHLLENSIEVYDTTDVEKKNSYFSFTENIRFKFALSIFDIIPGFYYELSYFLENDEWSGKTKRRIDHSVVPYIKTAINATDFMAIILSYKFLKNISTIDSGDYYDYNYDRHRISLEISFNF